MGIESLISSKKLLGTGVAELRDELELSLVKVPVPLALVIVDDSSLVVDEDSDETTEDEDSSVEDDPVSEDSTVDVTVVRETDVKLEELVDRASAELLL